MIRSSFQKRVSIRLAQIHVFLEESIYNQIFSFLLPYMLVCVCVCVLFPFLDARFIFCVELEIRYSFWMQLYNWLILENLVDHFHLL